MVRGRVKNLFITSIMIIFCFLFIHSTPVSAIELIVPVRATGNSLNANVRCSNYKNGLITTWPNSHYCNVGPNWVASGNTHTYGTLNGIFTNTGMNIVSGRYYKFYINVAHLTESFDLLTAELDSAEPFFINPETNGNFDIFSFKEISYQEFSSAILTGPFGMDGQNMTITRPGNTFYSRFWEVVLVAKQNNFDFVGLGNNNLDGWIFSMPNNSYDYQGLVWMSAVVEYEESSSNTTEYLQQEKQQDQQQGQQGQTDSNSAGQQVEGAATSLISVIGGFFGAFINASATNCVFNMGIILEEVDMCSAYIPATYNVILSIVSLLFIVPMVIWLINSILSAFKEFQE